MYLFEINGEVGKGFSFVDYLVNISPTHLSSCCEESFNKVDFMRLNLSNIYKGFITYEQDSVVVFLANKATKSPMKSQKMKAQNTGVISKKL